MTKFTLFEYINWAGLVTAIIGALFIVTPTMAYFFIPRGILSEFWAWVITVVIGMFLYVFYQGDDKA